MTERKNISLEGLINVRDLGGVLNEEGKRVKRKKLLRGILLDGMTENDMKILRDEYEVDLVIDLRAESEVSQEPDPEIEGVRNVFVPILSTEKHGITWGKGTIEQIREKPDMGGLYVLMVSDPICMAQFREVLRLIMKNEGAAYYHCTTGKDRTGITSLLLYAMLKVSEEEALDDYEYSNVDMMAPAEKRWQSVYELTGSKETADIVKSVSLVDRSYLKRAIGYMKEKDGSILNYIKKSLLISEEEIRLFQDKMLEEA